MWTKYPYGEEYDQVNEEYRLREPHHGYWTITNGHLRFDVHPQHICGRPEDDPDHVTHQQAESYATRIVEALNYYEDYVDDIGVNDED